MSSGILIWAIEMLRLMVIFAAVRILLCLFPQNNWFQRGGGGNRHVILSFVCYMAVVLLAGKRPAAGMLMIPKTICYIWMICLFL